MRKVEHVFSKLSSKSIFLILTLLGETVLNDFESLVILTVPHAKCVNTDQFEHLCDFAAEPAARCLSQQLSNVGITSIVYPSNQNRVFQCDMNRISCRNWKYRKDLIEFIQQEKKKNRKMVLIDVHSFPPYYETESIIPFYDIEAYVLDDNFPPISYSESIINYLKSKKVFAELYTGRKNDIHVEVRSHGIEAFLLEFSERLITDVRERIPTSRMIQICKFISSWIKEVWIKKDSSSSSSSYIRPIITNSNNGKQCWGIVIHGGAGSSIVNQKLENYLKILSEKTIDLMLKKGYKAIDVVHQVVREMEESGFFNAGKGSVRNKLGEIEMDACIMDSSGISGTVTSVKNVKHPITLAREIMLSSEFYVLSSNGAQMFAKSRELELVVANSYFSNKNNNTGNTVGCVCRDPDGNLAAATSTGGLFGKYPGRVGDVGVVGAGTYADENCAVSCTGNGEIFIKYMVAKDLCCKISEGGKSLKQSSSEIMDNLPKNTGGFIAIDKNCNVVTPFNTKTMIYNVVIS